MPPKQPTLRLVGEADDRRLGNLVVGHQRRFDLSGAQAVTRHIEHVCG